LDPHFLSPEEALLIHADAIRFYGGSDGVRDLGLLESALGAPQNLFAYQQADASLDGFALMAAAYWFHLTMNHPFIDGNKRTSFMSAVAFLHLNGWDLEIGYDLGLELSLQLTTHMINREDLAARLSGLMIPLSPED
jgi:death-on-curing protein